MSGNLGGHDKSVSYRLDADSIDFMVKHYINDDELVAECAHLFKDNYFSEDEKHYMVVVKYVRLYKSEFGDRPDINSLKLMLSDDDYIRNNYMLRPQISLKEACSAIVSCVGSFSSEELTKNRNLCRVLIKRFLIERGFHDSIHKSISSITANQNVIKEPSKFVEDITNILSDIQSVESSAVFNVLPDNWKPSIVIGESIGVPYLDLFMTGGVGVGDVYGILGGFGTGKTWMGVNIITSFCRLDYAARLKAEREGKKYKPRLAVYAHYEDSLDSVRFRHIASLSQTPIKFIIEHITKGAPLSTRSSYRDYELKRYANVTDDSVKKPECERFEEAKIILADHCRIISLNGENQNHKGKGYVEELAAQINNCVKSSKSDLGVFVLDYAKLMAERSIGSKGNYDNLRHLIKNIPEKVALEICNKHKCHTYILQQLSGAATKIAAGKPIHHSDASECKDFAENCHRVFCLGNKHGDSGVQRLDASKLRNDEFKSKNHTVIRFNSETCNFELNTDWSIDESSGFVPSGIANASMDVAPTRKSPRASLSSFDDDGI